MKGVKITKIKGDEFKEAAELLGRAFIGTPFSAHIAGGTSEKHLKFLTMGMGRMLEKKPGTVYVAKKGKKIVGVARMVKWPDCQKAIISRPEMIPVFLMAGKTAFRLRHFRMVWNEHDPKEPHWHLDPLGVLPEMQGKGIGSQLLEFYCKKVDATGLPAYHETDVKANVRLYKRFGFEVVEKEPIYGFTNWFMRRPAGSGG